MKLAVRFVVAALEYPLTIFLTHLESTAREVLPHAISVLKSKGYRLVTLADCLGVQAYQSVQSPITVSHSTFQSSCVL
jgi:hypothetical protein